MADSTKPGRIISEHFLDSMQYKMIQGGRSCGKSFINKILEDYDLKINTSKEESKKDCTHEFISNEYYSQPYGTCLVCGKTIFK